MGGASEVPVEKLELECMLGQKQMPINCEEVMSLQTVTESEDRESVSRDTGLDILKYPKT